MAVQKKLKRLGAGQYGALAVVLAVTTAGGYVGYDRLAPRPAAAARLNTADVTRGSIISSVSASGNLAAPTQSKLSFRTGGRLAQLFVAVGDRVDEGSPSHASTTPICWWRTHRRRPTTAARSPSSSSPRRALSRKTWPS